jgi:hypothetical protein
MCQRRVFTPQDLRFVSELKDALAVPHAGPLGIPWKAVYGSIGRSDGWYSRVLNKALPNWLPDAVDLRRIEAVTGCREPRRVLARWAGEELPEVEALNPFQMLAQTVEADDDFTTELSRDLADGVLDQTEARNLLPAAAARLAQSQKVLDALRKQAWRK